MVEVECHISIPFFPPIHMFFFLKIKPRKVVYYEIQRKFLTIKTNIYKERKCRKINFSLKTQSLIYWRHLLHWSAYFSSTQQGKINFDYLQCRSESFAQWYKMNGEVTVQLIDCFYEINNFFLYIRNKRSWK